MMKRKGSLRPVQALGGGLAGVLMMAAPCALAADEAELVRLAKRTAPGLLVSTSGLGGGTLDAPVAEASDFLLIHFNGVRPEEIPDRVAALRRWGKAIVCNEDADTGADAP